MAPRTIDRPRTSRWRGGNAYEERKTNNWAAFVGFMLGRGYSTPAIAEALGDGTTDATIRHMSRKWGLPSWGRKSDGFLIIPVTVQSRANLTDRARQHGLCLEEYCRRMLICGAMPRDRYDEIVPKEQFF